MLGCPVWGMEECDNGRVSRGPTVSALMLPKKAEKMDRDGARTRCPFSGSYRSLGVIVIPLLQTPQRMKHMSTEILVHKCSLKHYLQLPESANIPRVHQGMNG
jgi:hypothetical protein